MESPIDRHHLIEMLREVGDALTQDVEVTVVGGSAGMLIGVLPADRVTVDCDIIRVDPGDCIDDLKRAAVEVARQHGFPADWLNDRVAQLDVLPSGWRSRRLEVGMFGKLRVLCVSRRDLLAMKAYAGRMQDRTDILDIEPTIEELRFVRTYLDQLRVPSRQANLDQVAAALRFLDALDEDAKS